ncbi:MAG: hypothetical protein CYPHOPRED_004721 [Cyphobasidiales sp. Tagirdzhanova-0007]|nr:MAG: hypothetical protein CYPHOPRED_004721 [Cyphobasidiales sp. Tagirdzhanova-0007]
MPAAAARHYLIESFASGGGEAPRAELLGSQVVQLLLVKHKNETSAVFRDEVRQFGLAFRKNNPGLRDALMYNEASLQTVVDNGKEASGVCVGKNIAIKLSQQGLRTDAQREEQIQMQAENERQAVGLDYMQPLPADEDRGEGEVKGSFQPKIAALEGIEFDTGNS